jgi:hypothetical protein
MSVWQRGGVLKMYDLAVMISDDRALEIAKNLLNCGVSAEIVVKSTGLDESAIIELQTELTA